MQAVTKSVNVDVADIDTVIAMGQACVERRGLLPDVLIAKIGISVTIDT